MNAGITQKLLRSRSGNLGILCLNHPKALHALTLDMVHAMHDAFQLWKNDSSVKAIVIKSSEAKRPAFCAGGDVKSIFENADPTFFHDEYQVNHLIATSSIPIISLWDGVVMGGGVGKNTIRCYWVDVLHIQLTRRIYLISTVRSFDSWQVSSSYGKHTICHARDCYRIIP